VTRARPLEPHAAWSPGPFLPTGDRTGVPPSVEVRHQSDRRNVRAVV